MTQSLLKKSDISQHPTSVSDGRVFSQKEFPFPVQEEDWEVIEENIKNILLYVTNSCNSQCKICCRESVRGDSSCDMTKEKVKEILNKIGKNKRITLIGGEPTVRDDIFEIIGMIRKQGHRPEIFTNGLRLCDVKYVKRLKEAGLERVYFSFNGFRKGIYERMRGDGGQLQTKTVALRNLEVMNIGTVLSSTIAKGINEDQIEPIIEFALDSIRNSHGFIEGVYFFGFTDYGRNELGDGYTVSGDELLEMLQRETGNQVRPEYLKENRRFMENLYRKFRDMGLGIDFPSGGLYGLYRPGSIKEYIPLEKLKEMNRNLEDDSIFGFLHNALSDKKFRKLGERFLLSRFTIDALALPGNIVLGAGGLRTPKSTAGGGVRNSIGLELGDDKVMANSAGHDHLGVEPD